MRRLKIYWSGERKNIIGEKVRLLRKQQGMTQRALAEKLQLAGFDVTDLTILRIESGDRFVPDYEVRALANALSVSYETLLDE